MHLAMRGAHGVRARETNSKRLTCCLEGPMKRRSEAVSHRQSRQQGKGDGPRLRPHHSSRAVWSCSAGGASALPQKLVLLLELLATIAMEPRETILIEWGQKIDV